MGNYISNNAVYLSAKRIVMKYNVESRAFKELEKQSQKPVVAPKHEAGIIDYHKSLQSLYYLGVFPDGNYQDFDIFNENYEVLIVFNPLISPENTEYLAKTTVVNKSLDGRLKDVYVTSKGLVIN